MRFSSKYVSLLIALACFLAQPILAQLDPLEVDLFTRKLEEATGQSPLERDELLVTIRKLLMMESSKDPDFATAASVVELERERQRLMLELARATGPEEKRIVLLETGEWLSRALDGKDLSPEDVDRLTKFARFTTRAVDDLNFPSESGEAARIARVVHGLNSLVSGTKNQNASQLVVGLRDALTSLNRRVETLGVRTPLKSQAVLDLPASVASSIIDVTREGFDEVNQTLADTAAAIAGDEEAWKRAIEGSKRVQKTLSKDTFGRRILDSLADRVVDKVPFFRNIYALASPTSLDPESPLVGRWASRGRFGDKDRVIIRISVDPRGVHTGRLVKLSDHLEFEKYELGDVVLRNVTHEEKRASSGFATIHVFVGEVSESTRYRGGTLWWKKVAPKLTIRGDGKADHLYIQNASLELNALYRISD